MSRETPLEEALHRLRSKLARVQAELEVLSLDGINVGNAIEGTLAALNQLSVLESLSRGEDTLRPTYRVLVADDDTRLAELLIHRLARHGVSAAALNDWTSIQQHGAAVLVADLGVLKGLAAPQRRHVRELPLIVITGSPTADHAAALDGYNLASVLIKPFSIESLLSAIRSAAEGLR